MANWYCRLNMVELKLPLAYFSGNLWERKPLTASSARGKSAITEG